ncbi:hypothetical protein H9I80_001960 [Escherichia coli]|nr:hypothetical protein [Escherichia coli]EGC2464852.1 hypothetical protein [Escherichia coli]
MPSRAIKDFAYIVIFLSRQTTRRQQPSRYGQRGQGVNGGSVKIWTGVWVKQAGCCYQTIQENMLKGGISGRSAKGKRIHTRAIHSIDTDIKLNRALWVMAETLLESLR